MFNAKDDMMAESKDKRGAPSGATRPRRAADDPVAAGLKRLWADVEAEPVPDDFLRLLDAIDEAAGKSAATGKEGRS
ncbi:MAG: NepR family anti-sigma factor [Thermaurantiacus sp.]